MDIQGGFFFCQFLFLQIVLNTSLVIHPQYNSSFLYSHRRFYSRWTIRTWFPRSCFVFFSKRVGEQHYYTVCPNKGFHCLRNVLFPTHQKHKLIVSDSSVDQQGLKGCILISLNTWLFPWPSSAPEELQLPFFPQTITSLPSSYIPDYSGIFCSVFTFKPLGYKPRSSLRGGRLDLSKVTSYYRQLMNILCPLL